MPLDLDDIRRFKNNILDDLQSELLEVATNCVKTQIPSLVVIFGQQQQPTQFDIEIRFSSSDDLDHFNIINPVNKKTIARIDKDSLARSEAYYDEINSKYKPLLKSASTKQEQAKLTEQQYGELSQGPKPIQKLCQGLEQQEVIDICREYANSFSKMKNKGF